MNDPIPPPPDVAEAMAFPSSNYVTSCSRAPQQLGKHDWYYEYPACIILVHETRDDQGRYIQTDQIKIPWRKLEASRRLKTAPRTTKFG
jgi:hypothetical protein